MWVGRSGRDLGNLAAVGGTHRHHTLVTQYIEIQIDFKLGSLVMHAYHNGLKCQKYTHNLYVGAVETCVRSSATSS